VGVGGGGGQGRNSFIKEKGLGNYTGSGNGKELRRPDSLGVSSVK
jgi:hypothetical protein